MYLRFEDRKFHGANWIFQHSSTCFTSHTKSPFKLSRFHYQRQEMACINHKASHYAKSTVLPSSVSEPCDLLRNLFRSTCRNKNGRVQPETPKPKGWQYGRIVNTEELHPRDMICVTYIIVNTLHKGNNKDNNNNIIIIQCKKITAIPV